MNNFLKFFLFFGFAGIMISCGKSKEAAKDDKSTMNESALLFDFIGKSGDVINSEQAPFLVPADELNENLGNYKVLDIRDSSDYIAGHIDGATLVQAKTLIEYLDKSVNTNAYEKVVIACYSGQTASYYTTLLRLIGHGNVYSLKFGMSGWSKKISPNKITTNISDKYAENLEIKANTCEKAYDFPTLKTGESAGYSIVLSRVKALADDGFSPAIIKVDSLMKNPTNYFIVNYLPLEHYNKGHLPGSFQFEPSQSIAKDKMMKYLPNDKPIVVYCLSGQSSASIVAYLRVLGYNALSLSFGANGFMHNFTQSFNDKAFNPSRDIADYPLVEGKSPSLQTAPVISANQEVKGEKAPVVVPIKKKQKTGGGGC